jgi:hypothetical protein
MAPRAEALFAEMAARVGPAGQPGFERDAV